jgi:hypothetical protein
VGSSEIGSRKKERTLQISDMERLVSEVLDKVTQADRASCVHHAVKLQDVYAKELGRDNLIANHDQLTKQWGRIQ